MNDILTIKELINYLETNFNPDDKLCRWYERGAYMQCEPVSSSDVGNYMFIKVKDDKNMMKNKYRMTEDEISNEYASVDDDYVLIF